MEKVTGPCTSASRGRDACRQIPSLHFFFFFSPLLSCLAYPPNLFLEGLTIQSSPNSTLYPPPIFVIEEGQRFTIPLINDSSTMSSSIATNPKHNDPTSKRRRFQPAITSFFSTTSNPTDTPHLSHNHYAATTYSPTPIVSAKVQSSLLSVGMRVRKSVAEGYKTKHPGHSSMMFAAPETTHPVSGPHTTELAPFSGMTKPGHHDAVAPFSRPSWTTHTDELITDDGDAFSLPPSSQDSVDSLVSGQKRTLDSDEYEDDISHYTNTEWTLSEPGLNTTATNMGQAPVSGRTILAPTLGRQRRRFVAAQRQGTMDVDVDDFEEPSFLRRREEVDMEFVPGAGAYEVQMGGV